MTNFFLKMILILLFCGTSPSFLSAQIKKLDLQKKELIGRIAPGGAITVSMQCYKYEDDSYVFRYRDAKYSKLEEWKDFRIRSSEDFETLYSYLADGFKDMPEDKVLLDIGNEFLMLEFGRFLGGKVVRIYHSTSSNKDFAVVGYTNQYTAKQIDKLFNKK
ncbi:hypothetical protein PQ465_04315 [Sphingobacterium oryzagri]|uniref:Uncharacterized protein n=1 Tax=Sphingobacterium oryzagri TaxID=3025669 RepID=A0ABY7WJ17_9SPHI|nr:hypothetical protein [Sphingobacterium sp. KACC 22765]WDF69607.1 hypothetical protein PQ465_04315 [Sphingobacterium sp. KACC 22765]